MPDYIPRFVDAELKDNLGAFGAILIVGPKWCGKTTTAMQVSKSVLRMQDPNEKKRYLDMANLSPSGLLEGNNPRLIAEWQTAPALWDAVRLSAGLRNIPGLYILTGSADMNRSKADRSGAGSIVKIRMGTMSLFESKDSTGDVSMKVLFNGDSEISGRSDKTLEDVAQLIVRGGWPKSIGKNIGESKKIISGYCSSIVETEVNEVDGKKRDSRKMSKVMRSLSRDTSSPLSKKRIISDVSAKKGAGISPNTLDDYLDVLRSIYVLEDLPAWNPDLRSKTIIRSADKVHMCDPALSAHFLSASCGDLMHDPETFGQLFESLVIRDLRAYVRNLGGDVFHYRDASGLEADAIIRLHDGRWAAIEAKLSEHWADLAAENLLKLRDRVDTDALGEPAFLAVVVCTGNAYTRKDGVHVIPITCLRD